MSSTVIMKKVVAHKDVPAFQWFIALITKLLNHVQRDRTSGNLKPENQFEIHVFVTSFEEKLKGSLSLKEEDENFPSPGRASDAEGKIPSYDTSSYPFLLFHVILL
jgi:hypothetical protein